RDPRRPRRVRPRDRIGALALGNAGRLKEGGNTNGLAYGGYPSSSSSIPTFRLRAVTCIGDR
ncbi:MAG TPA: hypothetical protein VIP78_14365, partial [Candidatus Dormibacteraeota bacterium]